MEQQRETDADDDVVSFASENVFFDTSCQAEEGALTWRNNPLNNFSDWKLHIKISDSRKKFNPSIEGENLLIFEEQIYYVHRAVIAIGERRSCYFANILHYGIDDGNRSSSIELSSRAAEYFPDLLDFMYSSKAFAITTKNAVALLFLSQALQVTSLESRVKLFIDEDIKLQNFGFYMSDALHFGDEKIALKVINTCEKEAISLMSTMAPIVGLRLNKIFNALSLSSAVKAENMSDRIKQPPSQVKKKFLEILFRRKVSC